MYRSFSHRNFNAFPFPPFPEDSAGVSGYRPGLRLSYAAPDGNHRGVSGAKVRGLTSRIAGGCSTLVSQLSGWLSSDPGRCWWREPSVAPEASWLPLLVV